MANTPQYQPIFILPEGTQRSTGKNAQRTNIMAAKLVAETVRTTLGPKGMDKMIVDSLGDVIVTNDGVTILDEMQIEHPTAKMVVEIAKTQEDEVGDGTTTAVVIAGDLLKNAESLLDKNIHPAVIVKGYRLAAEKAQKILNAIAEPITEKDKDVMLNIGITAMTGKGAEVAKEKLAQMVVDAVLHVADRENGKITVDREHIKIEKRVGSSVEDSELVAGIALDKERVHSGMPRTVKHAKLALVDSAIEIKNTEIDAKIQITDPSQIQAFIDMEEKMIRGKVEKIVRAKKSDMEALARATTAKIVTNLDDLSESDLGKAGIVEEVRIGDENMTFVRDCLNPKAVTILVRGGTEHVADEAKRAIEDAVGDIASALMVGKAVAGAGAPEIELALQLRKFAASLSGREQLAVNAFADAMEVIPRTLAENAGLDPIDVLTELKAAHDNGQKFAGIDVFTGKVVDAWKEGVIEPLKIKTQAVSSAAEVAVMILRIDDVIAGSTSKQPAGMPPGGAGGMPPDMGM